MSDLGSTSSFDPEALVGTTLDGRYLLGAHLATGGMGAVFRATHVYMRKDVAIKVLRPDLTASGEIVERFRREAEIAASLDHPNIVRVSDFGRSPEGYLFLVMELLEGESLFDRIRREGALPPADAVPILVQVCDALEAAHARAVVHRDLKPENVFLARTPGGREVTKILDFGIAKIADAANVATTQAGMVVGTPEYLAPEQALGGAVDARADLYAVGLIAWRTLVGRHPFRADDARGLLMMQATRPVPPLVEGRPELAAWPALTTVVARACAKEPAERPASAAALGAALADALGTSYVPAAVPTPAPPRTPAPRASSTFLPFLPGVEVEPPTAAPPELAPTPIFDGLPGVPVDRATPVAAPPEPPRRGAAAVRARLSHPAALAGVIAAIALVVAVSAARRAPAPDAPAPATAARPAPDLRTTLPRAAPPDAAPRAPSVTDLVADLGRGCGARRTAARRLGELGDPAALPKLRALAAATKAPDGFHGLAPPEPACGAREAAAAVRRIEAARRRSRSAL